MAAAGAHPWHARVDAAQVPRDEVPGVHERIISSPDLG